MPRAGDRYRLAVAGRGLDAGLHRTVRAGLEAEYELLAVEEAAPAPGDCVLVAPDQDEDVESLLGRLDQAGVPAEQPRIVLLAAADEALAVRLEGSVHACLLPGELSPRVLQALVRGAVESARAQALNRRLREGEGRLRTAAEEALREREQRLRDALDAGELGAWSYDVTTGAGEWDEQMYLLYRRSPELPAPSGKDFFAYLHPEDRYRVDFEAAHGDPGTGGRYERGFRIIRGDGETRWLQSWETVQRDETGAIASVVGLTRDITDQHEAEEALRRSEERLRVLANLAPTFVWIADAAGKIVFTSERWLEYTGLTFEENLQWPERAPHPDDQERVGAAWAHALATGEEYRIELRNRRHDGEYRWMETRALPVRDEAGAVTSWLGATTDIHERWLAEQRMREDEERLRLALEVGNLGTFTVNLRDETVAWGERARRILRVEPDSSIYGFFERVHPEDRQRAIQEVRATLRPDAPETDHEGEYRFLWPDGSVRWIHRRWRVFFEGTGSDRHAVRSVVTVQDVTERRQTEDARRLSEERLRLALDVGGLATWTAHLDEGVVEWDSRGRQMLDFDDPDSPADVIEARAHPDDAERTTAEMRASFEPDAPETDHDGEQRIVRRDGSVRWIHRRWRVFFEGEGAGRRAVRALITAEDVTERRLVQEALRQQEERLRLALEAGGLGTWSFDIRTGVFSWDARMRELWDLGPDEEPSAELMLERTHPDDRMAPAAVEALRAGRPEEAEHEFRIVRRDGEVRWLQSVGRTEYDEAGLPLQTAGFSRDVTIRKRAEEALRERERELEVALELGELGTITRERGAAFMEMDARARQIYGLGAEEETPPSIVLERTHPDDRERLQAEQRRAWDPSSDGFFEGEYRIVWPDGTVHWVIRRVLVTFEGEGDQRRAVRGIATLRDVTEQRRLETAQREFLAMASHELRNPLAALTGNAQLLLRRGQFDRESAEVIVTQARHLERLVRDLLDVTAATAGQFQLRRSAVDLVRLASETAAEQQATTRMHRVHVRRAPASVRGMWDEDRLQQVVRNLVSNAIKYSPDGGEVAIDIEADDHEVRLSVEDGGTGIAESELEHIFERFYRSEPQTGRIEGLGLGLDVTRALVEAHGGHVDVTSSPGMGSTFTVRLPLGSAFAAASGGQEPHSTDGMEESGGRRLLVADDDPAIRRLLSEALTSEGYEVTTAADGIEVLAELERGKFDALLLDMMMPHLDGPGVVRELRRRQLGTGVPIVVVSASHAARTLGVQLGAAAVIEKPFEIDALFATLEEVTARR